MSFKLLSVLSSSALLAISPATLLGNNHEIRPYQVKMAELESDPRAKIAIVSGWKVITIDGGLELWSFTPENHPAHPSFARRTMVHNISGEWHATTKLSCGAVESECEKLLDQYELLDERMKDAISRENGT